MRRIRVCMLGMAVGMWLVACQPLGQRPEQSSWDQFTSQFVETYFARHPNFAAQAGRHEFDGKLPDWSREGLEQEVRWLDATSQAAAGFDESGLDEAQRFERRHLLAIIESRRFWLQRAEQPYRNPMFYAHALDPNLYVSRPYAPLDQRLRAFAAYARNIPQAAAQIRGNLRLPLPRSFIDVGKTIFGGYAKFYESDARSAFAAVTDAGLQKELAESSRLAAEAMRSLAAWLEAQRPRATDDFAMGPALFRDMLKATEQVDVPIDDLERAGRQDLDRNLAALTDECARYAPAQSLDQCVAQVETQKPASGPVSEAADQLVRLKDFIRRSNIVSIPDLGENASVAESPPYSRWNTAYIDIPGPYESGLPAIYYVAPPDPAWSAKDRAAYIPSRANLLFISAHEVWPGHFLQHLHARHARSKLGQLFSSYAFSEGWAHYTEELMWEAGLDSGDSESHIGQLLNALIRNVRFLSAIGLHTRGMSLETSERMFRELAFRDAGTARQQAARGTFDPAYLNYTLGKLMIRRLRSDWTAARGGKAAWKAFHDRFLSYGAPSIPLIREGMLPNRHEPIF